MKIVELPAHDRMTPVEALEKASRETWDAVLIVGWQEGKLIVRSSHMSRAEAVWLAEWSKMHSMQIAPEDM